jgi:GT2 family glycosyltransferase
MAFRRSALAAVGGFDEKMGPGTRLRAGEDVDVFWRLLRAGWLGRFDPDAVVTHHQWRGRRQAVRLTYAYGIGGGAVAAKAIRLDGRQGWRMLGRRVGRQGLARAGRDLAHGYASGVAMSTLLGIGTIAGALRAAREALEDGHFASGDQGGGDQGGGDQGGGDQGGGRPRRPA